jgi:hypothetical protein
MTQTATWHGTQQELRRLRAAVERHCARTTDLFASGDPSCAPHALLGDGRVRDHLRYVYRARDVFQRAEQSTGLGACADGSSSGSGWYAARLSGRS